LLCLLLREADVIGDTLPFGGDAEPKLPVEFGLRLRRLISADFGFFFRTYRRSSGPSRTSSTQNTRMKLPRLGAVINGRWCGFRLLPRRDLINSLNHFTI
jgi:hypothetical protein